MTVNNPCSDVTPDRIATETNCNELSLMLEDLETQANAVAWQCQEYASTAAIWAHEEVHAEDIKAALDSGFPDFKAAVEAIALPLKDYESADAAEEAILNSPAYLAAWNTWIDSAKAAIEVSASHTETERFLEAQRQVIFPLLEQIADRWVALGCD